MQKDQKGPVLIGSRCKAGMIVLEGHRKGNSRRAQDSQQRALVHTVNKLLTVLLLRAPIMCRASVAFAKTRPCGLLAYSKTRRIMLCSSRRRGIKSMVYQLSLSSYPLHSTNSSYFKHDTSLTHLLSTLQSHVTWDTAAKRLRNVWLLLIGRA